jgi:5-methylcytosine-specific restriction protein A
MSKWPYNTQEWKDLRKAKLRRNPSCEYCPPDIRRRATCVDHRKPIAFGGAPFPPLHELASSCWPCHGAKTARGPEAGAVRTSAPLKGCDAGGLPIDPGHPWFKGS